MSDLSQINDLSSALASDLAAGLYPAREVFAQHGIDPKKAKQLLANPYFQEMLKTARAEWSSVGNTPKRVKMKALIAIEEAIPSLYGTMTNAQEPAAARAQMFKEFKSLAGVEQKEAENRGAALPTIQIYLGGENEPPVNVTPGNPAGEVEDAEVVDSPLQQLLWKDK